MNKALFFVCLLCALAAPGVARAASGAIGDVPLPTPQQREQRFQLEEHIRIQEEGLALLERSEQEAALRSAELLRRYAATQGEVAALFRLMWPLHMQRTAGQAALVDWQTAERDFAWSLELGRSLRRRQDDLHRQEAAVSEALARQEELYARLTEQVRAVGTSKERLLSDLMATIEAMNLELNRARGDADFARRMGHLIRPAEGLLVARYAPDAEPPVNGLGFSLPENAPVRAVAGGMLVYSGLLRGFGHVLIVLHESDYYSLYAFLRESRYEVGQMLAPGDTLGSAGFYPVARGPGLYFELRFQKKAINPEDWLLPAP